MTVNVRIEGESNLDEFSANFFRYSFNSFIASVILPFAFSIAIFRLRGDAFVSSSWIIASNTFNASSYLKKNAYLDELRVLHEPDNRVECRTPNLSRYSRMRTSSKRTLQLPGNFSESWQRHSSAMSIRLQSRALRQTCSHTTYSTNKPTLIEDSSWSYKSRREMISLSSPNLSIEWFNTLSHKSITFWLCRKFCSRWFRSISLASEEIIRVSVWSIRSKHRVFRRILTSPIDVGLHFASKGCVAIISRQESRFWKKRCKRD